MKIPVEVLLHGKSRVLELVYPADECAAFSFEFLRVFSPSAEVQGHTPDQAKLQVGKREVAISSIEPVGQYALKISFSDGHDTGVYSWDYFELLHQNQEALWAKYLEDLEKAGASRDPNDPANLPFADKPKKICGHD